MDVMTFSVPVNQVTHSRSERTTRTLAFPSMAALREMPIALSFPVFFVCIVTVTLSLTPFFQRQVGFYRLDKMMFPSENHAESAMRKQLFPETDTIALAESIVSELPSSIQPIAFSSVTVHPGDTVSSILVRSGLRSLGTLLSVNGIANARRLRSGQVLRIPSMDGILYTVVRGDSLEGIASRYAIPVTAILDANDLAASTLIAKQTLFIPGASLSSGELRKALGTQFLLPARGRLTSRFGYRSDPFTNVRSFHTGIDLAAPIGTSVKATLDGKVATTGYSTVFGNYIILTHEDGFQTLYGHLSVIAVQRGQKVSQGFIIGKIGNTGYSTGSHLHFSVYKNGKMIDPYSVL